MLRRTADDFLQFDNHFVIEILGFLEVMFSRFNLNLIFEFIL